MQVVISARLVVKIIRKVVFSGLVSGSRDGLEKTIGKPRVMNLGHTDLCICQNSLKV